MFYHLDGTHFHYYAAPLFHRKKHIRINPTFNSPCADSVDVSMLNLIVRKTTHVIVFGILALLWLKALGNFRYSYLLSWFITFLYAMTDEWHQSYKEGRVASFRDVGLDSLGALLFLVIVFLMNKKRNSKQIV